MSSIEAMGTPTRPTSPAASARPSRSPSGWAGRRRPRGRSGPARAGSGSARWCRPRVEKPAYWRIVQKRPRYIVGWTPRVKGNSPGRPRCAVLVEVGRVRGRVEVGDLDVRGRDETFAPLGAAPRGLGRGSSRASARGPGRSAIAYLTVTSSSPMLDAVAHGDHDRGHDVRHAESGPRSPSSWPRWPAGADRPRRYHPRPPRRGRPGPVMGALTVDRARGGGGRPSSCVARSRRRGPGRGLDADAE